MRKNQPNALVSGRAGHGLGDYKTLGDMDVPTTNVEGMWESVDTTNDSWAFAWYDEYWKTPREILRRLISCVARGGTYMLNIGPRGDGSIPERAAPHFTRCWRVDQALSPGRLWYRCITLATCPALGDVTVKDNTLFLSIFNWPASGTLYLPGLKTESNLHPSSMAINLYLLRKNTAGPALSYRRRHPKIWFQCLRSNSKARQKLIRPGQLIPK